MLISNTLYMTVAIGVPVAIAVGLGFYLHRRFGKYGGVGAILLGAVLWSVSQTFTSRIYIVEDCNNVRDCRMLGSLEYDLSDGTTINVPYEPRKVVVLNNSDNMLFLEEIKYGEYSFGEPEDPVYWEIYAHSYETFEITQRQIDFFFDQHIPEEIEVRGSESTFRYWLYCE